jgi:hypothetical protein
MNKEGFWYGFRHRFARPRLAGATLHRRPLALACALACAAISAQAQQQYSESVQVAAACADRSTPRAARWVISASRDEQDADSLPMTVDVIDARQMEEEQIGDIRELAAAAQCDRAAQSGAFTGRLCYRARPEQRLQYPWPGRQPRADAGRWRAPAAQLYLQRQLLWP